MTTVQDYVSYCEQNDMDTDDMMSAAFFANRRKMDGNPINGNVDDGGTEWTDLVDFIAPELLPAVCPLPPRR
jgi:hypothetical protein